jgi:E3 ubiquitin-protein ligase DOA10
MTIDAFPTYIKFVGITFDITLYWKTLIDQLLRKLSLACYTISHQTMPQETLVMVYYAYFYSFMNYGIILGVIHPTAPVFFSCKKK